MKRLIVSCLLVLGLAVLPAQSAEKKTKILLIGKDRDHPFTTHEYMTDCRILAKCLEQTPGIEAVVSNGWPTDPVMLNDVKAIVLHTRRGGDVLFASKVRKEAQKLLDEGVGLTAIHWSTGASKPQGELWLNTLGGWFDRGIGSKLKITKTKLLRADDKHPICQGWKDYDLTDEYYLYLKFKPKIKPVMQVKIGDKLHTVGWVYERPKGGKSFGFVCGHFHRNFAEEPFRRAIVNGVLWSAGIDVPASGAPCNINAADMKLPPPKR